MSGDLHPRLSLNAIVTPGLSFSEDVDFWQSIPLRQVGLLSSKLDGIDKDEIIRTIKDRDLSVSSIVCSVFTLDDRSLWDKERQTLCAMIDIAAEVGGVIYGPPGKGEFDNWRANASRYAEAVAPCLDYGERRGVVVAFEPTLRPYLSFVHTLRDSLDLAEDSGAGVVVDIGNCYTERDVRQWIRRAGDRIAIVQLSDVDVGTSAAPGMGVRTLPGQGNLPLADFVQVAHDAGYKGPFEVEFLGADTLDRAAIAESLGHVSALLDRVIG